MMDSVTHVAPTDASSPHVFRVGGATCVALQCRLHAPMALICKAFGDCRPAGVVWCCRTEARLHWHSVCLSH
jgi:hypothetical protein